MADLCAPRPVGADRPGRKDRPLSEGNQEQHYERDYDYRAESPHLQHRHLYENLMGRISRLVLESSDGRPPEVLEIGAGDGAVSERLLALGCDVTGTEMSHHSVEAMTSRFGANDRFRAVHDPEGDLATFDGRRFDAILFASVLHHIPDYVAAIESAVSGHLRSGGVLISVQDPLWYPRMSSFSLRLTKAAFLSWRIAQGNIGRGVKTRLRRRFEGISEDAPGDAVEYHMVRQGVDEIAISEFLAPRFETVEIYPYWSSQGRAQQKLGEKLGLVNTFALFSSGYMPPSPDSGTGQ